ncbi:MAG: hypothetical protein J6U04_06440 [Salinivirgaceae bacterium]|nr:hypothetical protein [Salinivirgaceae bacterium]
MFSEGSQEQNDNELVLGVFTPHCPILSTDPRLLVENGGWFRNQRSVMYAAKSGQFAFFKKKGIRAWLIMPEDLQRNLLGDKVQFEPLR